MFMPKGSSATARAPSNIALIKYMGKEDSSSNLPANGSLSMTLNTLCTVAEVKRLPSVSGDSSRAAHWYPELPARLVQGGLTPHVPDLSEAGVARVLRHVERVRVTAHEVFPQFGLKAISGGKLELRTANNFPASSGIASSASSFAAVTLATSIAIASDPVQFQKVWENEVELKRALARVSRQGSGSSCRSFEGPWVLWEGENAAGLQTPAMPSLSDFILLIGTGPKHVSSSAAHEKVKTSPLWEARTERVASRLQALEAALGEGSFSDVARISWAEMWEMHSLFHSCAEPFSYWEPGSIEALQWLHSLGVDRPIVTMDAGANVHILVPTEQEKEWSRRLHARFPAWKILTDRQGEGASQITDKIIGSEK